MENKKWTYNSWMQYLYNTLNGKASVKGVVTKFGEIGYRTKSEIQKEIDAYKEEDTKITNKLRASYTIEK